MSHSERLLEEMKTAFVRGGIFPWGGDVCFKGMVKHN